MAKNMLATQIAGALSRAGQILRGSAAGFRQGAAPEVSQLEVYVFVDTNLLIQCRPLQDLNWSDLYAPGEKREVRLIVSQPVLREIDYRKNKGNDRVGKRARKVAAMLRAMLGDDHRQVRNSAPRVKLTVEPGHQPTNQLENYFNYAERDDQLMGTAYEFQRRNPKAEVRLLTHDTILAFRAYDLNFATDIIPDDWLLQPENTEREKVLEALKKENIRLKDAEPSLETRAVDCDGNEISRYESSYDWFDPLTDDEINRPLGKIKQRFPLITNFGQTEVDETVTSPLGLLLGKKKVYVPPTEEQISKYVDEDYPQWLENCEKVLRNLHWTLQSHDPLPRFEFRAGNSGTRPAEDALVTIDAMGDFLIRPSSPSEESGRNDGDSKNSNDTLSLPKPPDAPKGKWYRPGSASASRLNLARLQNILSPSFVPPIQSWSPPVLTPRDPNAFYFKPERSTTPVASFSLECTQWRHDEVEEPFDGQFLFLPEISKVKGAIRIKIQAKNLSKPVEKTIPVTISTKHIDCQETARELVARLCSNDG